MLNYFFLPPLQSQDAEHAACVAVKQQSQQGMKFVIVDDISQEFEIPKWDVALEALIRDEFARQGRFCLADLKRLAAEYGIRFDDLFTTLFELVIHRRWRYVDKDGQVRALGRIELERLFRRGRIHYQDVRHYTGRWMPCDAPAEDRVQPAERG